MHSFPSRDSPVSRDFKAGINCMADMLQKSVQWRYVLNLCVQHTPFKTYLEIVQQLDLYTISGVTTPSHLCDRTLHHCKANGGTFQTTNVLKTPPPYNFTLYKGKTFKNDIIDEKEPMTGIVRMQ